MLSYALSPKAMAGSFKQNRSLIYALTKREIIGRYRGSVMGILWSFFNPLLMLAVYTFVFGVVFKSRWSIDSGSESQSQFAIVLFAGLIVFNFFAECLNRAPSLIISNVNYVKKVVFPLEILSFVSLGAGLFHFVISFCVWLLFYLAVFGLPSITALFFPIVLTPFLFFTLALSWFLASLGVYVRDVSQIIGVFTSVLMFLTPLFFPASALPESFRQYLYLNPLTFVVEQARDVLIWDKQPDWTGLGLFAVCSFLFAWLGFIWFQKTRKGFADVL